jgi:hypothetical protein
MRYELIVCFFDLVEIHKCIEKRHVFDPCIFNPSDQQIGTTVDDLGVGCGSSVEPFVQPILTDAVVKERFSLWEECLFIDTFTSMASGKPFELDETEYPLEFRHPALSFTLNVSQFHVPLNYSRLCVPGLARNTLWSETVLANSFDDIREMTALAALHYSSGLVPYRLGLLRVIRRVMRFSREKARGSIHRFPNDSVPLLHTVMLMHFENLPPMFLPFPSLALFAPFHDSSSIMINNAWRSFVSFNNDLLLFFASFSYLHLPLLSTIPKQKYPLSTQNTKDGYSSAEVLLCILKAVSFIIQALYTPIIGPEIQTPLAIIVEHLSNCSLPETVPAPGLCTMESTVSVYIIASSALIGAKRTNRPDLISKVETLIHTCILPALQRIGHARPMANEYYMKLLALIQSH